MFSRSLAALALLLFLALLAAPVGAATRSAQTALDVRLASSPAERALAVSGTAPVLDQPAPMALLGGTTADQALHATDADGNPITFSRGFGPAYMTVTTTSPGAGSATGNVHLAPTPADIGTTTGSIVASDGALQDTRTLLIHVTGADQPPVLTQPSGMSVRAGRTADQPLEATDPDMEPLTFTKVAGPAYMSVQTLDSGIGSAQGNVNLAPGAGIADSTFGTVGASDGLLSDQKSFSISVHPDVAPALDFIPDLFVAAGSVLDHTVSASDVDGDMLTFKLDSDTSFVTVTTVSQSPGFALGNIHVAPPPMLQGTFGATVSVSDGELASRQSFRIFVQGAGGAPVMSPLPDVTMTVGGVVDQLVTAADPDGGFVQIYPSLAPSYMTLINNFTFPASSTIHLAPGVGDAGTAMASVSATDFSQTTTESFTITVLSGNFPPLCPGTSFPVTSLTAGFTPAAVTAVDLNSDGDVDLVGTNYDGNNVSVYMGTGGGAFASRIDYPTGPGPIAVAAGDFNGDGRPDLAVACSGSTVISVLLGNGDGTLGPRRDFPVGSEPEAVVAADLTGDGRLDLAVANFNSGDVSILNGIGDGSFGPPLNYFVGGGAYAIAAGDFDANGRPDLAVTSLYDSRVRVFLNNGSGGFTISSDIAAISPLDVVAADFNQDGKLDLAWVRQSSSIVVALGNGNGTFQGQKQFGAGSYPNRLAVADLNGDGLPDVATANNGGNSVSLLLGDGHGALAPRTDVPVPPSPYGISSGDVDGDLRDDLVVTSLSTNTLSLLLNRGCAPARNRPPRVHAAPLITVAENVPLSVTVTASDADGEAIASLAADLSGLPVGNNAAFASNPGHTAGTLTWTPTFNDGRTLPYAVTFTAANALSGSATTRITVANVNRAPVAMTGGPYTAFVNSPLTFDGGGSSDPDGNPLTYLWVFGDGMTGVGATPAHTYHATGLYGVAVTVSDGSLSTIATTTATVVGVFQARAFTQSGNRSIKLTSGKPEWCAQVEPIAKAYSNAAVNLASIVMKSTGTGSVSQIPAISGKTVVGADGDGNGVQEIAACFSKANLRLLFSDIRGTQPVTVTIEGTLFTGGLFRASMDLLVTGSGGGHSASVSPNPLNPEAVLTFVTTNPGPVRVRLFDLRGRLVRSLLDDPYASSGYHDVRLDGRDDSGARLASGLYFYQIDSGDGQTVGKLSVLK